MMNYTTSFTSVALNSFRCAQYSPQSFSLSSNLALDTNKVFNRFLVVNTNNEEFDVPIIVRKDIEHIIEPENSINFQTVLPLYENVYPMMFRTFDQIIKYLFIQISKHERIVRITTPKGEVYNGGLGLIFDGNYNPLILFTLRVKRIKEDSINKMVYDKPVIYISPLVFTDQNSLVSRGIIKKVIPYFTTEDINRPVQLPYYFKSKNLNKAEIIIGDLDKFFVKPSVPKPQDNIMESLNQCLIDNIDDIVGMI